MCRARPRRFIQPLSHRISFPFHSISLFPHGCVLLLQLTALGLCFVQVLAKRVSRLFKREEQRGKEEGGVRHSGLEVCGARIWCAGVSVSVTGDCVCFAAWIGERERGACAGVCRGNEAEEDRELQCKPLLEVEEEEEQEGGFNHLQQKSTGEEDKRGERQREEEEGVVRLHVSNELCSDAH